jgi:predicted GTPase
MGQVKSKSAGRRAIVAQQILPEVPDNVRKHAIDARQILPAVLDNVRRRAIDADAQQILPKVPEHVRFRVLIIGRANAGKTSILQRVCDTTEIPRLGPRGDREPVRPHF